MPEKIPRTLDCPSCGAPLDYDGKSATVRCKFCNHVTLIEAPKEEKPPEIIFEEVHVSAPSRPVIIEAPLQPVVKAAAATAASGAFLGCGITAAILLIVGLILGFAFAQPGGPFVPRMVAMDTAALLPTEGDIPPDVVSLFYNVNTEERLFARVSSSNKNLAWQAEPLPGDGFADHIVTDGNLVYTASEMNLFAYHASDGSLAWQVTMPDQLDYDPNSLVLAAGRVVTITLDRSLQAYDAQTGQLAWSRLLSGYDRQVRLMNDQIVVMDYLGDDYTYSLVFLNPLDGREESLLTPTCQVREYSSETLDTYSGILYEPGQNSLYLLYGTFNGCIQRINLSTRQVTWQTAVEDGLSFTPYGFNGMMTDSTIYFQNEEHLLAVDKAGGTVRTLLSNDDYEFMPLAVSGDTLVARARRTRGTERFELWGVDAGTGSKKWSLELENTKPLDPPNELVGLVDEDESGWAWRLTPTGLLLLDFQAVPNQLVLNTINPADGSKTSEIAVPLEDDGSEFYSVPTVIGWWNQVVYFILDTQVYAVDTTSGEVLMVYQ